MDPQDSQLADSLFSIIMELMKRFYGMSVRQAFTFADKFITQTETNDNVEALQKAYDALVGNFRLFNGYDETNDEQLDSAIRALRNVRADTLYSRLASYRSM
jgi:tRNA U38,U39,U40 pseudouridine synthase TruA